MNTHHASLIVSRLMVTAVTLPQVNKALRKEGIKDELVKGKGYFYFDGEALNWRTSSVYVNSVGQLSIAQWIEEYRSLKDDYDNGRR